MTSSTQHQPLAIDTLRPYLHHFGRHDWRLPDDVGLIRVVITLKRTNTLTDDLLCLDAMLFLFATISAYWAQRSRGRRRQPCLELAAGITFVTGMGADDWHLPVHHLRD